MDYRQAASALAAQTSDWRRDFHQHPELGFAEYRTAGIVAQTLNDLGLEVQTGVGKTGVVGILSGAANGPTVLVRCDMDALPIHETTGAAYASVTPGVMHACGHDGHTAIGLTVAHLLHAQREHLHGQVKFVFQPAEEIAGGARAMIEDGVLTDPAPDVALGLHLWNTSPVGEVAVVGGPLMAGADTFEITVHGRGGHGGLPHEAIDPVLAAAHIITALQSIVSRNVSASDAAVVSVTSVQAGNTDNVIPSEAYLLGTLRTFRPAVHDLVMRRVREIATATAATFGCEAEVKITELTPPVVNDPGVAARVRQAIRPYVAAERVIDSLQTATAEDMAIFLNHVPGCFFFVGSANSARGLDAPHHHPRFDFDEAALSLGAALLAAAVADYVIPG
ncbi:MAG: amidohydrolase [Anaerolineae bacterium]|nr:amidohydrolase [Anaerolineae bacterium]